MAMLTLSIDPSKVHKLFDAVDDAIGDYALLAWMNTSLADKFEEEAVERFSDGIDRRTGVWKPLADSTERIRAQQGYDPDWPINIRSGELFHHVISHDARKVPGGVEFITPKPTSDTITQMKMEHATFGSPAGANPLPGAGATPPRPVVGMDEQDAEEILYRLMGRIAAFTQRALR